MSDRLIAVESENDRLLSAVALRRLVVATPSIAVIELGMIHQFVVIALMSDGTTGGCCRNLS